MKIETKFSVGQEVVVVENFKYIRPFKIAKISVYADSGLEIKYLGKLLDEECKHEFYPEEFIFTDAEAAKKELIERINRL